MSAVESTVAQTAAGLRITEIFRSLQGEALSAGAPTVFVRLTGCPLRCTYCDTEYSFTGGERRSMDEILATVQAFETRHVCVTGGEPLAQPACIELLKALCDRGHEVSLETSGALDVSAVDSRVSKVLDLKTPASNEAHRNRWANLDFMSTHDQIKFVVCDKQDFDWAVACINDRSLTELCTVWMSPSHDDLAPGELADWILDTGLPIRLQVQLHKYLWGDVRGK